MTLIFAYVLPALAILIISRVAVKPTVQSVLVLALAYIPLSLVIGLREGIGRDYYSYVSDFNNINEYGLFYVEPGFYALNRMAWMLGFGPTGVFLTASSAGLILIWKRIADDSHDQFISFNALFGVGYVLFSLSAVRQALAMAILFYAIRYIWEGRFLRYVSFCLLGAMFHLSTVILIPFYFFLRFSYPGKLLWLVFAVSILALFAPNLYVPAFSDLLSSGFFGDYAAYSDRISAESAQFNSGVGVFAYALIVIVALLFSPSLNLQAGLKARVLSNSIVFGFCGYIFFAAVSDLSRLFNFFTIFGVLWHPALISSLRKESNKTIINSLLFILWVTFYLYPVIFHSEIFEPNIMPHFLL
jgi:transmembrane protein EpsG